ncbi:MAG: hypothetical protein MK078_06370 [Crocinitomicaceae bacterium]|nr:hypothetical protein [Crocinitomicaceae bacterium]
MVERKCLSCGTWNNDERFCKNCGAPLHPEEVQAADFKQREKEERELEEAGKDKLDRLLEKAKSSKYWVVRAGYRVMYSVSMVLVALGGFFAWLVAWAAS